MDEATLFASLALLTCALGGCNSSSADCPPPARLAYVDLGCSFGVSPVVKTTGPCTGAMGGGSMGGPAEDLILESTGAGTCQVELTFANGGTSTLNVVFVSEPRPYDDCDPNFIAVDDAGTECLPSGCQFSIQAPCDAGLDAGFSD